MKVSSDYRIGLRRLADVHRTRAEAALVLHEYGDDLPHVFEAFKDCPAAALECLFALHEKAAAEVARRSRRAG